MDIPYDVEEGGEGDASIEKQRDSMIETVLQTAWKYNGTYSIGNEEASVEDSLPIWYLMDEVGTRIRHDDEPSVAVAPFYFAGNGRCV